VNIEETIKARVAAFPFDLDLRYQDGESFMLLAPFEYRGRGICVRMEAGRLRTSPASRKRCAG
jgi:hypothetical protein